ncbi:MAG: O-antigen ligase family protein [Flavobacteriales bacterium]
MNSIIKYIAFIFLFVNVVFSIKNGGEVGSILFYICMGLALFTIILSPYLLKETIFNKGFSLFYWINLINLIYFIALDFGDIESFKYLIARFVQFSLFSFSILLLKDNFVSHLITFLKYLCFLSLFLSFIIDTPGISTRYMGIFFNPNEFSILMVTGFAIFLFDEKKIFINYLALILFLLAIILSGSRSAILGIVLSLIVYFNHHGLKNIFNLFFICGFTIVFTYFTGDYNAITRIFNEDLFSNRIYEYLYAIETLMQKPVFGYGLKNYAYIDTSLISFDDVQIDFGAHNGYLSLLVQYGLFFGFIYLIILLYNLIRIFLSDKKIFGENILHTKFLVFILIYSLVNGMFENNFVGINFFQSNLFWLVLGYLIYKKYRHESHSLSN